MKFEFELVKLARKIAAGANFRINSEEWAGNQMLNEWRNANALIKT